MELEVGSLVKGKVTGIMKFGAFVDLGEGKSGLIYISEIADSFVKDVNDYLEKGQEVTVKIIGIDEKGRINLSLKKARVSEAPRTVFPAPRQSDAEIAAAADTPVDLSFEDKLKRFLKDSESKLLDVKRHSDPQGSRKKKRS